MGLSSEKNDSGACYQYFKNKITDKPLLGVHFEWYSDQILVSGR